MKEIIIAFDIDGTILNNEGITPETPTHLRPRCGLEATHGKVDLCFDDVHACALATINLIVKMK